MTDQLGSNIDWSTFQWTSFGFGDTVIVVPANAQHYETTLPMTYNGVTFRVVVDLNLDPTTGMVHASFQSLNAATLMSGLAVCPGSLSLGPSNPEAELPPGPLTGFLPPEDGTGRGIGYISYTVSAKSELPTGTQIRNVADVTFDFGPTIATDQISETDPSQGVDSAKQALVTLDTAAPTSHVAPLPLTTPTTSFLVAWSGADDPMGSGIAKYDVFVSDNGSAFTHFQTATTDTSATFTGQVGHTYTFYSVATDNVGHVEANHTSPDTSTLVVQSSGDQPGDYNRDGYAEAGDYALWRSSFGQTGTGLAADGNQNGVVDAGDYLIWRKNSVRIVHDSLGDYNHDGAISKFDYDLWRSTYGQVGQNLPADGNHDGVVDAADYVIWRSLNGSIVVLSAGQGIAVATSNPSITSPVAEINPSDTPRSETNTVAPLYGTVTSTDQPALKRIVQALGLTVATNVATRRLVELSIPLASSRDQQDNTVPSHTLLGIENVENASVKDLALLTIFDDHRYWSLLPRKFDDNDEEIRRFDDTIFDELSDHVDFDEAFAGLLSVDGR